MYEHITKMENIMVSHDALISELETLMDRLEKSQPDYLSLIEYYYSNQRNQDLEDDNNDLIPKDLNRGVLSEDGIFDLVTDHYNLGLRMIELGLKIVKER